MVTYSYQQIVKASRGRLYVLSPPHTPPPPLKKICVTYAYKENTKSTSDWRSVVEIYMYM